MMDAENDKRLESLVEAEFSAVQRRNERRIALFACGVATIGAIMAMLTGGQLDGQLGLILSGLAGGVALYYGLVVRRLAKRVEDLRLLRGINVTIEISIFTVVTLLDLIYLGPAYALTSTPPLLTFLAVITSGLRLSRQLSFYSGALAALQWMLLYTFARETMTAELLEQLPSLGWPFAIAHGIYLLLAGVLAALIARMGRGISRRVAAQVMEQERVKTIFGEYVAPQAVEKVLAGELAMDGEVREVTILFADIRSFTALSTSVSPEQVVAYLNDYFEPICEIISRNNGMVNKFMGDGVLAIFGAPEDDPDHALNATRAAFEMAARAAAIERPDGMPTRIGVGVHRGQVVLGSIGSSQRKDYTVIGDVVNTASRIEGLTLEPGDEVLISDSVRQAVDGRVRSEPLGPMNVKGRAEPVVVHRVVGVD